MASGSLLVAIASCQPVAPPEAETAAVPVDSSDASSAEVASAEAIDPRDQYQLAHEIQRARTGDDLETALARTRAAWVDRRFRWELAFLPALCQSTGPCVALPFDHARDPEHPIRQGWLPRLDLDENARSMLANRCPDAGPCVVELSGRLAQLQLSSEKPPSLTLSQIEIHDARGPRPNEAWIAGARRRDPVARSTTVSDRG